MKRFKPVKLTTRIHSRHSKRTCHLPITVKVRGNSRGSEDSGPTGSLHEGDNLDFFISEGSVKNRVSEHENRNLSSLNNWTAIRQQLVSAFVSESCLPAQAICIVCNEEPAVTRCVHCGPKIFTCKSCCLNTHSRMNHFHTPELWKDGTFVPLIMVHSRNIMKLHHIDHKEDCRAPRGKREITVIDIQGNHHFKQIEVCSCEKIAATLLRYGLWPGSPEKPTVAFQLELMELLRVLFIHCKVSLNEMVEVLEFTRQRLMPKLTSSLYSTLNSGCFEEYRLFYHKVHNLHYLDQRLYDGTQCPMCPQENGILIESMDACFGLCRKKAKGAVGVQDGRHKNAFFADQDDVDNFIDNYTSSTSKSDLPSLNKECSSFHAGEVSSSLRSKGKNKLLDEKAVFGRVCRHDYPKGFLNIKHGERISYSVYECKRILDKVRGKPNLSVIIMYDIACILGLHIKRNPALKELSSVPLAIPIFHCYGHKASCQVQYSPRRTKSLGLTDGEGTERLWAFLRDFSRITKEMGAHKRVDVLTDGLIHYGQQLLTKQASIIKNRLKRTTDLKEKTKTELREITSSLPSTFVYSISSMEVLMAQEQDEIQPKKEEPKFTWDEQYADLLIQHARLRNGIASTEDADELSKLCKKSEKTARSLKAIEKSKGIRRRWTLEGQSFLHSKQQLNAKKRDECLLGMHTVAAERTFLLELKKKYADGQAIAKKISKTIDQATTSLNKLLNKCNAFQFPIGNVVDIPFDEAKYPSSHIYTTIRSKSRSSSALPNTLRRRLIEAHCLQERCGEEIALLSSEVERLKSFYLSQIKVIDEVLGSTENRGVHSQLLRKKILVSQALNQLKDTLSQLFPDTDFSDCIYHQPFELSTDRTCIYPANDTTTVGDADDSSVFVVEYDIDSDCGDNDDDDDDDDCDAYDSDLSSEGVTPNFS